jgi:hypothetical protein
MERTQVILHQGKKIVYIDFSNLRMFDEIKTVIEDAKKHIHGQPPLSVLTLTSVEETHFNSEIKDLFTAYISSNKPYVKARAILGVTGLKQVIYNGMIKFTGNNIRAFTKAEDAKNWLVSQ